MPARQTLFCMLNRKQKVKQAFVLVGSLIVLVSLFSFVQSYNVPVPAKAALISKENFKQAAPLTSKITAVPVCVVGHTPAPYKDGYQPITVPWEECVDGNQKK